MALKNIKKYVPFIIALIILLVIAALFTVYVHNYYRADSYAMSFVDTGTKENVTVTYENEFAIVVQDNSSTALNGLIFYPGGKVQAEAYIPLMTSLAENGFVCIVPVMPLNLAVFDKNAADRLKSLYPEIKNWYMGGHSFGGSIAASYLASHGDDYKGLILLASYSFDDLRSTNTRVLSVYGSEDGVLNREHYQKYRQNLSSDLTEKIINGGCHSYFGSYGMQKGDGMPLITPDKQREETVDCIKAWILEKNF